MPRFATLASLSLCFAVAAHAEDARDASQRPSFRKLMYGRDIISTLERDSYAAFRDAFDWFGMDERTGASWDPLRGGKNVQAWCESATRDMQEQLGRTDERDEAEMTLEAAQLRCAQAYDYRMEVRVGYLDDEGEFNRGDCEEVTAKDGTSGYRCAVEAMVHIRHFVVDFKTTKGKLRGAWSLDDLWLAEEKVKGLLEKEDGEVSFRVVSTGTAFVTSDRGLADTRDVAEQDAAYGAGRFLYRKVLNIQEFRQSGPLQYVREGRAGVCLGSDQVYKDMPFVVYSLATDGTRKRKGFVKIRKVADGCVMTTELREREKEGEEIELGPSDMQIILGRKNLQPAMTAERLPDMGLNVGGSLGIGSFLPFVGFGGHLVAEQSLARWTDVSELHATLRLGVATAGTTLFTLDTGVRKRGYLGPMFLDGGVFFSIAADDNDPSVKDDTLTYYGARLEGGFGAQLSPRVMFHVPIAFTVQGGSSLRLAPEAELEILYTF